MNSVSSSRRVAVVLAIVGVIVVSAVALVALGVVQVPWAPPSSPDAPDSSGTRLRVEYALLPAGDIAPGPDDVGVVADIVRRRLESVGITDASVEVTGSDRIAVEVPSLTDGLLLRRLVAPSGRLDVVPLGGESATEGDVIDLRTHPPLFGGDQIASAAVANDDQQGASVDLVLRPEAARLFEQYTAAHIDDYFAITLDGRVLSAPVIRSAIEGGQVRVSIGEPVAGPDRARELAAILQFGSFPWALQEVGTR